MHRYLVFLVSLFMGSFTNSYALAHEGSDVLSQWYKGLMTNYGTSCCEKNHCFPVDAITEQGHWQVLIDNKWLAVPDASILHQENKDSRPVVCMWPMGQIICFIPPPET